jgi:hypothetical protein
MKPLAMLAVIALAGCASSPAPPVQVLPAPVVSGPGSEPTGPLGSPFADRRVGLATIAYPLIIDRGDLGLGATVQYSRVPSVGELHDLDAMATLRTLVLALPAWPSGYAAIEPLQQLPPEIETWVILPGYPPTREAAEAWNELAPRLRIVVVVTEPPPSSALVADLNAMRALDRLIAQIDDPRRTGFERFQRPLSFRVLKE